MKQVLKYRTGQLVPDHAIYLTTVVEDIGLAPRYVWHYFLVDSAQDRDQ